MSHSLLAPSASSRWMACPGSMSFAENREQGESTKADSAARSSLHARKLGPMRKAIGTRGKLTILWIRNFPAMGNPRNCNRRANLPHSQTEVKTMSTTTDINKLVSRAYTALESLNNIQWTPYRVHRDHRWIAEVVLSLEYPL